MMSLEQVIEYAEEVARANESLVSNYERDKKIAEIHRQIADLLKELAERRKAPEIIYCKDCRKHNVKVGFDENFHTVWKEDACPLVDWRGKAQGHEFDYQYCVFAERRTE